MKPVISVVMPVFNGEKYLRLAMESILNQTFKDFEFIIINDGSTDKTEKILKNFSDPRIVYINNETNLGLSKSFNVGIRTAQGECIARMDADDIALPNRFNKQLEFLKVNPHIGIIGSSIMLMDESGRAMKKHSMPSNHLEIKWKSLFSTPLIHPTVMARAEILKNNLYDESILNSEDYELWSRLLFEKDIKFANISEPLLYYRVFKKSFTQTLSPEKRLNSIKNIIKNIERYTPLSEQEKQILSERSYRTFSIYQRAAREFEKKESFKPNLSRYFLSLVRQFARAIFRSAP